MLSYSLVCARLFIAGFYIVCMEKETVVKKFFFIFNIGNLKNFFIHLSVFFQDPSIPSQVAASI